MRQIGSPPKPRARTISNFLIRKFEAFSALSSADRTALDRLWSKRSVTADPHCEIVREGDPPKVVRLFQSGWACRYKMLQDGRRQILGFLLPGDISGLDKSVLQQMDHSVLALTTVRYAKLDFDELDALAWQQPRISKALRREMLVDCAIQREWTLSLGQRLAIERLAHLLCELFVRLRVIGMTDDNGCSLPVTQIDLGDALGLSAVHISRTLRDLRERRLAVLREKHLHVLDFNGLARLAMFSPGYLHLERPDAPLASVC